LATGDMGELYILIIIVIVSYTIKGLTGFGPALLIVPLFSVLKGAPFALTTSAIFDAVAGFLLLSAVYKNISWKFCIPLMISMGIGSFIGANLVLDIPLSVIEKIMGVFILSFGVYLWIQDPGDKKINVKNDLGFINTPLIGGVFAGFVGGITGGLIGMSGPILIIYLKYFYSKDFFRSQLIVVFLIENIVRIMVYSKGGLFITEQWMMLIYFLPALSIGLWIGNAFHIRINDKVFDRVVGMVLMLVSTKIILL
jgi:uncharacterized membrane protein YfcA